MQDICGNIKIPMTMMSLFDGSGGFPLAATMCGITPITASEIEPFPIRVTTKRLPQGRHLGDIQGFDPAWCDNLETADPTEEDIAFWSEVWETHRRIVGTSMRPKSHNQIVKWLHNPHSDAAEYKLWGNGLCVHNAFFVLQGIVEFVEITQ
ncbi:hypothetical protein FACS1894219_12670 [Clostridia bacterium]|nr:hypothetical protein FACS1894219_12670 [Clostridia bacterium]